MQRLILTNSTSMMRFRKLFVSLKTRMFKKATKVMWVGFPVECSTDQEKADILYRTAALIQNTISITSKTH